MNASALLDKLASGADLTVSDKLMSGIIVTILAMSIVFLILILLIFAIKLMGKILYRETPKVEPAVPVAIREEVEKEDDLEVVAVITAAIAEMMNKGTGEIRVTRIQRLGLARPTWATTGKNENNG